jgi:hypothetical protein
MVLTQKKYVVMLLLLGINASFIFGSHFRISGLVQYGKDIDRERLELLEDREAIRFIERLNYEVTSTYTIRNSGNE